MSPRQAAPDPGTVLGFDFGTRRIGVAVGNRCTATASPLTTLSGNTPDWTAIRELIDEWQPANLVVGLPYNSDGSESEMTARARRFSRQLNGRTGLPVHLIDERLTSKEAETHLREQRRRGISKRRIAREDIDMWAAQVILSEWLAGAQEKKTD